MARNDLFPQRPESRPMIYAFEEKTNPGYKGLLKVGYTTIEVERRIAQQYPTKHPHGKPYKIVFSESAMYADGTTFSDHDVHKALLKRGIKRHEGEWFECTVDELRVSYLAVKNHRDNEEGRTRDFRMRPEQEEAVKKTIEYYSSIQNEYSNQAPKFLWNAKMRFGKTFAAYQLARRMNMKKVLILTFKPAVECAWSEDLITHVDFEGWQFICPNGLRFEQADLMKPIVCFGSFQDYLGTNEAGGIKEKNEWVHSTNWDLVIFDEYHFGAWRDSSKKLFEQEDEDSYDTLDIEKYKRDEADNAYNETFLPITTKHYLFLSGTPFRALNSGEFIEEQIYNWTYSDEQRAKENWGNTPDNPYAALPRMVMMTYKIPESIRQIALQGEFNEFDLNIFFSARGTGKDAKFVYENEVQKWLDLIRGSFLPSTIDELKLGQDKRPPMPFSDARLLNVLTHTLWFLPNVASCCAMKNLLRQRHNIFYHDYIINICAGSGAGIGAKALEPVEKSMEEPLKSKTITLSCGKLTTGVTIRPWTGIFMLRNLSSPETYFQAAFRVQSPWEIDNGSGTKEIIKRECYIFDFALDRALKQIADYSCRLNVNESNPEIKVNEFINFLPVIAYDGSTMRQIDAEEVLDIAMAGTSATLLARRWESALLVNVDNDTLQRLMANQAAMDALMRIEGFRSLNADIQTIINKSEAVKKTKKDGDHKLSPEEKKELTAEEKEYKSLRKQIQEKLIKFATRVPIFMYLTDYRERSLQDVITQFEPGLFKKVTGLDVMDFDLLVSLDVFNRSLMNDAIYKFKRYEDSSLSYTGINRHEGEDIGLFDSVVSNYDYMYTLQQASMSAPPIIDDVIPDEPASVDDEIDEKEHLTTVKTINPLAGNGKEALRYSTPVSVVIDSSNAKSSFSNVSPQATGKNKNEISDSGLDNVKVGSTLTHHKFGNGIVIRMEGNYMTVAFAGGEKRFVFPDSITNGFLTIK